MLIDLLAIGSSGFNPQNSFLNPLNQHELSIFWGGQFAPVYPGQFAPELGGQFQPGKVVSLLRNMWSVYSVFSKQIRKELIQLGLKNEWISDGLSTFYNALKINGEYSRWGRSLLQSIYDLWFSRTDFYDREACIIKLTHGFETYLKKLDTDLINLDGLGTCIHSNFQLESLYTYRAEAKSIPSSLINHEKRKFSKTIGSLVFFRNLFTHDNNSEHLEMGLHNQIKFASDFIALYVYVGYLLKG